MMNPAVRIVLADPEGSGLFNKVWGSKFFQNGPNIEQIKEGVMYDKNESEGRKRRHQVDTVVEGM
jgi:cysteine synthase